MGLAGPVGVDGHACDGDGRGAGAIEEGTREPRDVVLLHRDIEIALVEHVIVIIEGRDLQGDVALHLMEEGVEIELLLRARRDIEGHRLLAIHGAKAGFCIERARAAGVVELHLLDVGGDVIGEHEAAHRYDAVEGGLHLHGVFGNGDRGTAEERLGVALGVGELDLPQVGHRGVAIGAVAHDHQGIVAGFQLEGGLAEIGCGRGLVDLLYARAAFIVDGEVEAGADGGHRLLACASEGPEGGLFDLEDRDCQVGIFADHTIGISDGLLAGEEEKECA